MRLSRKRAIITGASQGIGAEIAKAFAREGASVALVHRSSGKHEDPVAKSIVESGGDASSVHADVSDPASVKRAFSTAGRRLGGLDILVNAAGFSDARLWKAGIRKARLDDWKAVFSVDAFGTFLCSQAAIKQMKRGSIINVASTPAVSGDSDGLVYAAAKGAVLSMTRMLAKELAPDIRVNCMVFGSIETGWVNWLDARDAANYRKAIPMKRFGTPSDAALLATYLASDESSFMTGQAIVLDGGEVMR